ncbi:MAG: efflux transporter outer membrane subunit [Candidatus Brocadia sp.]|nr:efflux transporter outer membrane subunit [Candidatus Brocadia sp.]
MAIRNVTTRKLCVGKNPFHAHTDKNIPKIWWYWIACVLVILIPGCTITQDYQRPQVDVPDKWRVDYQTAADLANTAWWEKFQDPVLNELIRSALTENKDLHIATARIEEFAGKLQTEQAGFYPQIIYGDTASRNYQSKSRPIPELLGGDDRKSSAYRVNLGVSWELDIWGRIRRAEEAGRADLLSSEEGRQAVILMLVSAVADGYIKLLGMDKQMLTYKNTLASRKETLDLFERKYRGGQISGFELTQVMRGHESVSEYIPSLERQIALTENSLSVLLGRNPGTINRGKTIDTLVIPEVPQGIPSDILERRPDIRQIEQNLIAANAKIGVARTQYFPTISLTGLFGYSSPDISTLLQNSSNFWQAGAAAIGTIFDGGRIKGEIRQAEARHQQLLNTYLSTIQNAFREVNDSLISIQKLRELLKIQNRHISVLKDNVSFARSRYESQLLSNYNEVLEAEKNLLSKEVEYILAQMGLFEATVNIFKAMGGGWVTEAAMQMALSSQKAEPTSNAQ